ncbi:hypothetical protein PsorP6_011569 [Peronosclerospora sorghi]|uniref:Uncharacterized protein n=1 Tax=Peronosclerospora sorghi TaxID=230839 RepID=A0ACC0WIU6_9STRA|nr:hypothetical protein PsorP6_011569 [Peronosclerospora sorghi]
MTTQSFAKFKNSIDRKDKTSAFVNNDDFKKYKEKGDKEEYECSYLQHYTRVESNAVDTKKTMGYLTSFAFKRRPAQVVKVLVAASVLVDEKNDEWGSVSTKHGLLLKDDNEIVLYKTHLSVVNKKYFWPNMTKYIQCYVKTCEICQCNKSRQLIHSDEFNYWVF